MYQNLLEGLEVSVVPLGEIVSCERFDSEYYRKTLRNYQAKITSIEHKTLEEIADFLIGPFGSAFNTENYVENGKYRYVRGKDVKPFILANNDNRYVPKEDYIRLNKYALREKDILVSVVGTLGNACIVTRNDLPAIFSCKSTVIRCRETNPYFLLAYLNCKNGKQLLARNERGANQKGLNLPDIQKLPVPIFTSDFQEVISNIVCLAYDKSANSGGEYHRAENLLLHELGLSDHTPSNEQISIRSIRDIAQTGRIDAEYYQPEYDNLIAKIRLSSSDTVETGCNIYDTNYNPDKNIKYKYIELADIGTFGEINSCTYGLGSELPSRARRIVHSGNIIIPSVEGSLQSCAIITDEYEGALCSTGFYVIDSNKINSETLLVLFKSAPMQSLLKQQCTGTILTAFSKDGLLTIPLPGIDSKLQETIKNSIAESFKYREESKNLLAVAKRAVEMAIEQDEESAIQYLNRQLQ